MNTKPVIALDGEGITYEPGQPQEYRILNSYDSVTRQHSSVIGPMRSDRIFGYLLSLPKDRLKIAFGLNYDANQWLVSLPREPLEQLWFEGKCRWQQYRINWTPGRVFRLSDTSGRRVTVWDIFPFFQCSFTEALARWKIGTELEVADVQEMKNLRGSFTNADLETMLIYCRRECELLAELFARLHADIREIGFNPSRYDGAGALASNLLTNHGVRSAIKQPPERVRAGVYGAYYGGRTEVARIGEVGDLYTYDIRSAYPAAIRRLPCLRHSHWIEVKPDAARELTKAGKIVLSKIAWDAGDRPWPPFPWRRMGKVSNRELQRWKQDKNRKVYSVNGGISYPQNGIGWHWSPEIKAAIENYPDLRLEFGESHYLEVRCQHEPFSFIDELYAKRKAYELRGEHGPAHVIKIALAAISGKLSQSESETRRPPRYQSFVLAGLATSLCRAWILDAIARDFSAVVSVATDGIASLRDLHLVAGDGLGEWKRGSLRDVFIGAPGIYSAVLVDGSEYVRTRGFKWRELDFAKLRERWRVIPTSTYNWQSVYFHGLGFALRSNWHGWRSWLRAPKSINMFPNTRFPKLESAKWTPRQPGFNEPFSIECIPPRFRVPGNSELPESWPYEPKNADRWILELDGEQAWDLNAHYDDGRL